MKKKGTALLAGYFLFMDNDGALEDLTTMIVGR
jgi:hypothetical protein